MLELPHFCFMAWPDRRLCLTLLVTVTAWSLVVGYAQGLLYPWDFGKFEWEMGRWGIPMEDLDFLFVWNGEGG